MMVVWNDRFMTNTLLGELFRLGDLFRLLLDSGVEVRKRWSLEGRREV